MNNNAWDVAYERKAVILLAIGFGLVGLDRWVLPPLFPAMIEDLQLSYSDLGSAVGTLALAWGIFSILMGWLSDRIGRRRILIPSLLIFSVMSVFTGMINTALSLLMIRAIMGASEGAFLSTSVATTGEASHPTRLGLNQGFQLGAFSLIGLGLGPIIATQLLAYVPSWRWVFAIVALPGFLLAIGLYFIIREPAHLEKSEKAKPDASIAMGFWQVIKRRNVLLAMGGLTCAMTCIFVIGAMVPSYLVDYLKLSQQQMGVVMSAMGFGGFTGALLLPGVSDFIGRRVTAIIAFVGALVATWMFMQAAAQPGLLFAELFVLSAFSLGILTLLTGPIATEAVPPVAIASAIGLVSGAGEILGGGVSPIIAGFVAQNRGIENVFYVPLAGLSLGLALCFLIKETAPRLVAKSLPVS